MIIDQTKLPHVISPTRFEVFFSQSFRQVFRSFVTTLFHCVFVEECIVAQGIAKKIHASVQILSHHPLSIKSC